MVDLTDLLADLAAESAELDALVARAAGGRLGTPDPGRRAGRSRHQIAHLAWTDHVATLAATDADAFYAHGDRRAGPDPASSTAGAEEFLAPPADAARPLAGRAGGAGRRPGRRAGRREAALVRHPDVGHLDGHRPAHGDLGARAGRRRRARRGPAAGGDRLRHVAHLGVAPSGTASPRTAGRRRPRRSGSSWPAPAATPGRWGPADAADR